jgi:hypothetical protein
VHTVALVQQGQQCRLETIEQLGRARKSWRIEVSPDDVAEKLQALRNATVPAFPVSPLVLDGEYVELTIRGEYSDLRLGWWTHPPFGADALADFADWLRKLGLPGEVDDE